MSASAQFSSETSAVSKEMANLSLWIFLLTLFDPLLSAFFLHVPKSCTEPQILMLACLKKNKTGGSYLHKIFFMKKICSILCTSGSHIWFVASKLLVNQPCRDNRLCSTDSASSPPCRCTRCASLSHPWGDRAQLKNRRYVHKPG